MDATDHFVADGSDVAGDDEITERDVCASCRAQAIALSMAESYRCVVTFVCVGGHELPWTAIVRQGHSIKALASGLTQEDALVDALVGAGVLR